MDKVQVACLFAGIVDHWHEGIIYPDGTRSLYKCSCMEHQSTEPLSRLNPSPLHNDGDYWRLVKGMMSDREKWDSFSYFAYSQEYGSWIPSIKELRKDFIPDFLLDPAHFIDLMWDFTGQEEVQKAYGWVECKRDCESMCPSYDEEKYGICSGKLPAPWLEERRKS